MQVSRLIFLTTLALGLPSCDDGGGSASPDCRRANAACAEGFICQAVGADRFECVASAADGGDLDGAPADRGVDAAPDPADAAPDPADAAPDPADAAPDPADAAPVERAQVAFNEGVVTGARQEGDMIFVDPGDTVNISFEVTVRNGTDCADCAAQITLGIPGGPVGCLYEGRPGRQGQTARSDIDLVMPASPGPVAIHWQFTNAADCAAAVDAFSEDGEHGGLLFEFVVRPSVRPVTIEAAELPAGMGAEEHCDELACPEGLFPTGGGGFFGQQHDIVSEQFVPPDRWRRCVVGEAPDVVPPADNRLQISCARLWGVELQVRVSDREAGAGRLQQMYAPCERGEVLIGGGGAWPAGWTLKSSLPSRQPATGLPAWLLEGVGAPGPVRIQALCARGVPAPTLVEMQGELNGGAAGCAEAPCPEGQSVLSGGGRWGDIDIDESVPLGVGGWQVCGVNGTDARQPLTVYALCAPF